MKTGVIGDVHRDKMGALSFIIEEFIKREVKMIFICGDLPPSHADPVLFNSLPVIYALVSNQKDMEEFIKMKGIWILTEPGMPAGNPSNRIVDLNEHKLGEGIIYVGHDRSFDYLYKERSKFIQELEEIRNAQRGVNWFFSGASHHQVCFNQRRVIYINPGAVAVEESFDGAEFAIIDMDNKEFWFRRFLPMEIINKKADKDYSLDNFLQVAVISDTANIAKPYNDPDYWAKLAYVLEKKHKAKHLIICGNIALTDIGREELKNFEVYVNILDYQKDKWEKMAAEKISSNWHIIERKEPIEIEDFRFLIDFYFGETMSAKSEEELLNLEPEITKKHPGLNYILFGHLPSGFYEEGEKIRFINPGEGKKGRNYAVISLPKNEIYFGHVPLQPLPPLKE